MSRDARREKLLRFLESVARPEVDLAELHSSDELVDQGWIDSLALIEIVTHLEDEYDFDFRERGVDADELRSVDAILDLIETAVG